MMWQPIVKSFKISLLIAFLDSISGYYATTLEACVNYICSISGESLGDVQDEVESLRDVKNQERLSESESKEEN